MSMQTPVTGTECVGTSTTLDEGSSKLLRYRALLRQLAQWLAVAVMGIGSYWIISHFFLQTVSVVGGSMSPTLEDSHKYLLNRWVYMVREPQEQEIVVIRDPADHGFSVKRVIAGPGHAVYIKRGSVFIDGKLLEEPYLRENIPTYAMGRSTEQLFKCGDNQFFVLGDNRSNSIDSRTYGPINRENILGLIVR